MEDAHLKTIDELNESFIENNSAKDDKPIPVTYDGEALVNSLRGSETGAERESPDCFYELFPEIGRENKFPALFIQRLFLRINKVKNFFK